MSSDPTKTPAEALAELQARLHGISDAGRPEAVARRRKTGQRTARENVADLVDPGSFVEYGGLAVAAQRQRHSLEELEKLSPADGVICGLGTVDGGRVMVLAYDYTVFAGTQGHVGHAKLDRMLALAAQHRVPLVLFAEGGGGRPNDVDIPTIAALDTPSFLGLAALSGLVPRVGIASGRCFAGNAVLLGSCDVVIATENSNIGMGGPAMIEGGGLGSFKPEEIGPIGVQAKNGVVDVRVKDEAEAVAVAKKYLSYFHGTRRDFTAAEQASLRAALPERRRRAYKVRPIIETLADAGSVLELRRDFGRSIVTALVRLEGQPFGVLANDTFQLGGAIDADAADKAAHFITVADSFHLPLVFLADNPGMLPGSRSEQEGVLRSGARMFAAQTVATAPKLHLTLRKAYGFGSMVMSLVGFDGQSATFAYPGATLGAMGASASSSAMNADEDVAASLRRAELQASYRSAEGLGFDELLDPTETRDALLDALRRALYARQAVPEPVSRTAITP